MLAQDTFTRTAALAGSQATVGGTWTGTGSSTDFSTNGTVCRRAATDEIYRYNTLSPAAAAVVVETDLRFDKVGGAYGQMGLVARYVSSNSFVRAVVQAPQTPGGQGAILLYKMVAGTLTYLGGANLAIAANTQYRMRLRVTSDGRCQVSVWLTSGSPSSVPQVGTVADSALATGGALASGKAGLADWGSFEPSGPQPNVATHELDNFLVYQAVEIVVPGLVTSETFGTPTVTRAIVSIAPAGVPSAQAFGIPNVRRASDPKLLFPIAIPTKEAFGNPVVANSTGVAHLALGLYITHPYRADLTVALQSPEGNSVLAINGAGLEGDNFGTSKTALCVLDDNALTSIDTLTAAGNAVGSFKPSVLFSALNGLNSNGTWKLVITDTAAADAGNFEYARLTITRKDGTTRLLEFEGSRAIPDDGGLTNVTVTFVEVAPLSMAVTIHDRAEMTLDAGLTVTPPRVADDFIQTWQGAGNTYTPGTPPGSSITTPPKHVGVARPRMWGRIRTGRYFRDYRHWNDQDNPVGATIAGSRNNRPWQATWKLTSTYVDLPNILQFDLNKSHDQNGISQATLVLENIMYPVNAGGGHDRRRGYMAPLRGELSDKLAAAGIGLPTDLDNLPVVSNEWRDLLIEKAQITIHQTYGTSTAVKSFTGLIDEIDTTSHPDKITVTLRDFGQVLADEHFFGWNKDPVIKDPVVFIDRDEAEDTTNEGYDASSSSAYLDNTADLVIDSNGETEWISKPVGGSAWTEWVQVRLPQGRYNDYFLNLPYNGLTLYVSVFAKAREGGVAPTRDGVTIPVGWVTNGSGDVPGENGGIPYVKTVSGTSALAMFRTLDAEYRMGEDSIIRISFRNLAHKPAFGGYVAGVTSLRGRKRRIEAEAVKKHWVLVDDISDVVKVILRWAGFKEWEVETTGTKLPKRMVFDRGMTFMDAIQAVAKAVGYTFFMKDPTADGRSQGVPVFRKTWTLLDQAPTDEYPIGNGSLTASAVITDRVALTGINIRQDDAALMYIIRVRGRTSKKGNTLGGDSIRRLQFTFRPPWSSHKEFNYLDGRLAGILRHQIFTNELFKTMDDCRFAAYFLALQQALVAHQATIQIPAFPGIDLDERVLVVDLGTGLVSRLTVASRTSSFIAGDKGQWTMTLGGSLIDVPDVQDMVKLINAARAKEQG